MTERRVVITGMGWVTPLGTDLDGVWNRLLAGETGIGPIERFDASTFSTNFAAEVKDFDLRAHLGDRADDHAEAGISTKYALAAAMNAVTQAGFAGQRAPDPARCGVYLGAGEGTLDYDHFMATHVAGWDAESRSVDSVKWAKRAHEGMNALLELEQEPHLTVTHLAEAFGASGPAFNCMTACAASAQATGEAAEIIKRGDADVMLAGGAHTMIHPFGMSGFIRLTAMSTRRDDPQNASRPFDAARDGFVMGEGAGILVLEDLDHARARGATILAEVAGYGSTADAYRITDIHPEGKGAAGAMRQALGEAGIDPSATDANGRPFVHYINAHGTGTQENDKTETAAVKAVFGEHAPKVPFSSIKSMLGHLIQAAGAVELITCVKAIETGWVPPTRNLENPDPVCDLDYVPGTARDLNPAGGVDVCLSNSFGFGGQNDTVCVRRYRD
ncbi:MAG: 3-oxoacyl-[acyl-carrier-protein] synthase 2 [Phycisphaeraceae bacterium]|nr:MAG: 3-oxoacyl-[acyl-carrier-protein] synthase 2 [Phycisphaeraceae bacterium]